MKKDGRKVGEKRDSRAVIAPFQGGGMVMFSCTADAADATEAVLDEARAQRKVVDIADILAAVDARLKALEDRK